jgi:hypothetical protein
VVLEVRVLFFQSIKGIDRWVGGCERKSDGPIKRQEQQRWWWSIGEKDADAYYTILWSYIFDE